MRPTLYGLSQSVWTERARWALDHHGIAYRFHEHVPLLGELFLRRKARSKKPSVPLFVDGDTVVMGSFEIGKHAERVGRGAPLFPRAAEKDIAHWADVADRLARIGRAWLITRMTKSRAAQAESLPPFLPAAVRNLLAPTTVLALRFLNRKYDVPTRVDEEVEHTMRPLLAEVRAALRDRRYLLDAFSFADIVIAAQMMVVRPPADARLGPATREALTNEPVARDFADLLAWRDAVYAKHR